MGADIPKFAPKTRQKRVDSAANLNLHFNRAEEMKPKKAHSNSAQQGRIA